MPYTEIVQEALFSSQLDELKKQFPRVYEIWECADWQIGRDHALFPEAFSSGNVKIQIWRSDPSDNPELPTFEIAYYYSINDGKIHFLAIRPILFEIDDEED